MSLKRFFMESLGNPKTHKKKMKLGGVGLRRRQAGKTQQAQRGRQLTDDGKSPPRMSRTEARGSGGGKEEGRGCIHE